ncbi:unnamed protein product [Rotaria socialis]|uniref:Uncharacterized protein n=1 Tax=Rotaria socialis TaxID=392032 RepID=A0A817NMK2_9BILA|nr:unnamed protein product [Rotaria socialis]CAF4511590.1 unnamed protein product [Rotaria socialis]
MNFPLPTNATLLRGDSFYSIVEEFCGREVLELLKFQLINSSMDLIEVDDVFSILQIESDQTTTIKEFLGIPSKDNLSNYSFFIMPGIRLKLEKFIRSLRALLTSTDSTSSLSVAPLTISSELLQRFPFVIDLIYCLESQLLTDFSLDFISNLLSNITCSKNAFRYQQSVKDFAASLYILGGRNVYEFVRLNLPGSIPCLNSLRSILTSSNKNFVEGEFQYEHLKDFIDMLDCKYAFCGEDSTSVVPKVSYDSRSNSFVGFTLPLNNGFPSSRYFTTNSFGKLETWFEEVDKSFLINVHVIQAVCSIDQTSPSPFLLAAYGTNSKYTAQDILERWSRIFDSCMTQNIRILGFSADCDPKQMKAMRDSMGFFSKSQTGFEDHPHHLEISSFKNTSWFFLKPRQLFVCLQDASHLCTKLRNRLLSSNTILLMGEKYASIDDLIQLIDNHSKIDHGLTVSDICPKDKQNYSSCEKITSTAVLSSLKNISNSEATQAYLEIIKCVRLAYVDKNTTIINRLYYAWCAVFIVRIWSAWLQSINCNELKKRASHLLSTSIGIPVPKKNFFITIPALFSLELNAHSLTYLTVLLAEQKITKEALNISLFNSQICESTFRAARSMSGPFSSVVNFSVYEFLQRVEKLAVLQNIKCSSEYKKNNIIFPTHHKQSKQNFLTHSTSTVAITITEKLIEEKVFSAYIKASQILSGCEFSILNPNDNMISFEEVNRLAFKRLSRSKCTTSKRKAVQLNNDEDENEDDDDEEEDEDEDNKQYKSKKQSNEKDIVNESDESSSIDDFDLDILPNVSSSTIREMRIFDSIDHSQSDSFLPVEVNGRVKYMHKQTANWYFSKTKPILSSDRLKRVQQAI